MPPISSHFRDESQTKVRQTLYNKVHPEITEHQTSQFDDLDRANNRLYDFESTASERTQGQIQILAGNFIPLLNDALKFGKGAKRLAADIPPRFDFTSLNQQHGSLHLNLNFDVHGADFKYSRPANPADKGHTNDPIVKIEYAGIITDNMLSFTKFQLHSSGMTTIVDCFIKRDQSLIDKRVRREVNLLERDVTGLLKEHWSCEVAEPSQQLSDFEQERLSQIRKELQSRDTGHDTTDN